MRLSLRGVVAVLLLLIPAHSARAAAPSADELMQRALAARTARQNGEFLALMKQANAAAPKDPLVLYNLACAYTLNGQGDAAVATLDRIDDLKTLGYIRTDGDFDPIRTTRGFRALVQKLDAADPNAPKPKKDGFFARLKRAFGVGSGDEEAAPPPAPKPAPPPAEKRPVESKPPDEGQASGTGGIVSRLLTPHGERSTRVQGELRPASEAPSSTPPAPAAGLGHAPPALAYDLVDRRFFMGTMRYRRVLAIARDGTRREFDGGFGFLGVTGLKVDPRRRVLWVASAEDPRVEGSRPADDGRSALHAVDIETGRLVGKYVLEPRSQAHRLGQIAVAPDGTLYVADARAGTLYTRRADGRDLEQMFPFETFPGAAGVALDEKRGRLYVSCTRGIDLVELDGMRRAPVRGAEDVVASGAGALQFYEGDLVTVQPQTGRIVRYELAGNGRRVRGATVIEPARGAPRATAAVVAGETLYYLTDDEQQPPAPGRVSAGLLPPSVRSVTLQ